MCEENCITRRGFIGGAAAVASTAALAVPANVKLALDDPKIIQGYVRFPNGPDMIDGYLARPKAPGRHKVVLTMSGPDGLPTITRNAAAMLAEAGFIGLAISWSSREGKKLPDQRTVCTDRFMQRWIDDARAGLNYLRAQPFAAPGKAGAVGFCGGGELALLYASRTKDLGAVVAFYAPPKSSFCTDPADTRRPTIDFIDQLKAPAQFHYGTRDDLAPLADIEALQGRLRQNHNDADVFIYEGARHAFHDVDRAEFYNAAAANLSWKRTLQFLRQNLSR